MMGHNIITARAITSKCGIIKSGDSELVMVAIEFNKRVRDTVINEVVAVTNGGPIDAPQSSLCFPKLFIKTRRSKVKYSFFHH